MKKNILIISLCFILLIMGIGYSAFSSKLNINSSSSITSNWDVEITSIKKTNISGNVIEKSKSFTKDTATFNVEMEKPGNYVYYKIGVTNKGSIAAIATLGNLTCSNDAFECGAYADSNVSAISQNTDLTNYRLVIDSDETEYYNVYIKFKNEITEMPNNLINTLTLNLTYKQSDVGITHKDNCYTGKVLKNGTISITDYDETCGNDVVIPESIDGYTVTEIADGKWDNVLEKHVGPFAEKKITSVIIPDTITYIGSCAFISNKLQTLTIGKNVKTIGNYAFKSNNISELTLSEGLEKICLSAFASNKLKEISYEAFATNKLVKVIIPNNVTALAGGAFANNNLNGEEAFIYRKRSDGTTDYTILNSYAGKDASNVVIPNKVKTIDYYAFRGVYASYIEIPENVNEINSYAFFNCNLSSVKFNEGLKEIGNSSFLNTHLTSINLPTSLEKIGTEAFRGNKLKTVTIGNGVKTIGEEAFKTEQGYNPIETITINQKEGAIAGSPWGSGATINWIG